MRVFRANPGTRRREGYGTFLHRSRRPQQIEQLVVGARREVAPHCRFTWRDRRVAQAHKSESGPDTGLRSPTDLDDGPPVPLVVSDDPGSHKLKNHTSNGSAPKGCPLNHSSRFDRKGGIDVARRVLLAWLPAVFHYRSRSTRPNFRQGVAACRRKPIPD